MTRYSLSEVDLEEIPVLRLTEGQSNAYRKMLEIITYFFTRKVEPRLKPFRGFLLEGPPSSGKTELAFQVARGVKTQLAKLSPPSNLEIRFIDSSTIAAPHWGEAEQRLRDVFDLNPGEKEKVLLIFDDIDCLMMTRGAEIAREWHYSINAVIFHRLDNLNPTKAMVIATTNRPDLIDEALRSRLYTIKVPGPEKGELFAIAKQMAEQLYLGEESEKVAEAVIQRLSSLENPTLRDIQHYLVVECIERGFWRVAL